MPCDELSKACEKVGRFLHDFALVEQEINSGIAAFLKLNDAAAIAVCDLDFMRKLRLWRGVALEAASDDGERRRVTKVFSDAAEQNNYRNRLVHDAFEPATDEAVQFHRVVICGRFLDPENKDLCWTEAIITESSKTLTDIKNELAEMRPALVAKISEDHIVEWTRRYLHEPTVTWVPTPLPGEG